MGDNVSQFDKIYHEYLSSTKTKIARHQARRSLERKINFGGKSSVKDLILHLLHQKGHHVFQRRNKENKNKPELYIGTKSSKLMTLNKTTFQFAMFLIEKGYCNKDNKFVDFDKLAKASSIYNDNWLVHVNSINITDVLLSDENFGKFSALVEYINGIKSNPKDYIDIHSVYDKQLKKLDIFEVSDLEDLSDSRYIKLINVTSLLREGLRNVDVKVDNRDRIIVLVNTEYHYRINKLVGEI